MENANLLCLCRRFGKAGEIESKLTPFVRLLNNISIYKRISLFAKRFAVIKTFEKYFKLVIYLDSTKVTVSNFAWI